MRAFKHLSKAFFQTHPKEAAWYLESLPASEAFEVLLWLEPEARALLLGNLSLERASTLVREMPEDAAVESLKVISTVSGATILQRVDSPKRESLLNALPSAVAESLRDSLEQSQFTLAPLMQTKALTVTADKSVSHALDLIKRSVVTNQTTLFVLNENRNLLGTLHLKDLLAGGRKDKVGDCMNASPKTVRSSSPRDILLSFIDTRELTDLAVVDEKNVFRGFIPFLVWLEEVTRQLASYEKRNQAVDTLIALGQALWIGASGILETLAAFSKTDDKSIQRKGD